MKIISIMGTRPQLIKVAEMCRQFDIDPSINHIIINTGQHYTPAMDQNHIVSLDIPEPDRNLGISGGTNVENTANMMVAIEKALNEYQPDIVLVYGDTDSTLAGALAAKKSGRKLAHLEAGALSGDWSMQEEINRILVDSLADLLLFASKAQSNAFHLKPHQTGIFVGDLMLLSLKRYAEGAKWVDNEQLSVPGAPGIAPVRKREFYYMTLHRAENVDNKERLQAIINTVGYTSELPVFLAIHPRLANRIEKFGINIPASIIPTPPQSYQDNIKLIAGARKVLTDSGGMQKEAYWLKTPCVTLRSSTEWPETLNNDRNILTGADRERIRLAIKMVQNMKPPADPGILFGSGLPAGTAMKAIRSFLTDNLGIT